MASPFPPEIQIGGPAAPAAAGGGDVEQRLAGALDEIRSILSEDGFDEQERLTLEKVTTLIQGLHAAREKQNEAAMGTSPAIKGMARSYGG